MELARLSGASHTRRGKYCSPGRATTCARPGPASAHLTGLFSREWSRLARVLPASKSGPAAGRLMRDRRCVLTLTIPRGLVTHHTRWGSYVAARRGSEAVCLDDRRSTPEREKGRPRLPA